MAMGVSVSFFFFLIVFSPVLGEEYSYVKRLDPKKVGMTKRKEKLSNFRFYWHDNVSGPDPTSVSVVQPPTKSTTAFGLINMIDNPLTMGPKMSSKMVGKAQGLYSSASQEEVGLLMIMNFAFFDGKYNGSTFTVLGRNTVFSKVREMAVIGGSGLFRFARGYVQAQTYWVNLTSGDAIVEYNAYVLHYWSFSPTPTANSIIMSQCHVVGWVWGVPFPGMLHAYVILLNNIYVWALISFLFPFWCLKINLNYQKSILKSVLI